MSAASPSDPASPSPDSSDETPVVNLFGRHDLPLFRARWRVLAFWMLGWFPPAFLAWGAGELTSHGGFFQDYGAQTRLLVAGPLFILARPLLDKWLTLAVERLYRGEVVPPASQASISDLLRRHASFTSNLWVFVALAFLALTAGSYRDLEPVPELTWRYHGGEPSAAYKWFSWVSSALTRFLVLRWVLGFVSWFLILRRMARVLCPNALHPDRRGGLGTFIGTHAFFAPFIAAFSASFSGDIANEIVYQGASVLHERFIMLGVIVALPLPVVAILTPLSLPLRNARIQGIIDYGILAQQFADHFAAHWFRQPLPSDEELRTAPDFSAHTDLSTSYAVVDETWPIPISKRLLIALLLASALPMVPVVFIVMPVDQVLRRVTSIFF